MSNPNEVEANSIRDYELMSKINNIFEKLDYEQITSAHNIVSIIKEHLYKKYFDEKIEINVRSLVKTFEDLNDIALEKIHNESIRKVFTK